jgi:NAD(P)-dependent dehydrogenase (short-subunit alcohol dehydrogenase family)
VARLDGRVALVTGGADGIGAGIVRRLVEDGARVMSVDIDDVAGPRSVEPFGDRAAFCRADVTKEGEVRAMVRTTRDVFGNVDVLVNNAWGGGGMGRVEDKTNDLLQHGLDMAFYAAFWAMRECFPHMLARGWGRVINVCSLNGVNAHMGTLEYNVGKEALRTLTRTAAREWADTGIVVNAVCPAAKSAAFRRVMGQHPELEAAADLSNPMKRIGDAFDDIAPVVSFLASDDCRYLTGNTLFVDGGSHINGSSWAPDLGSRRSPST